MTSRSQIRSLAPTTFRSVVAWLCVLLILVVGAAHLLHTHSQADQAAEASCGLCAVAHLSVLPEPVVAQPVVTQSVSAFRVPTTTAPPTRRLTPSLYVRPPPVLDPRA